jgi:hypothetical protein
MATTTVTFKRTFDGRFVNVWIHHPDGVTEKLIFTNGFASSSMTAGTEYHLLWVAAGVEGSKLSIEKRTGGGAASKIVDGWKIPPKPGSAPGQVLVRTGQEEFTP